MGSTEPISATDGPWDKHKDFWLGLATQVGATAQQAKFAFALATGHSQSSAAKFADYAGEPRTQGYSTARTRRVKAMLVLAEADGWQSPSDTVDEPTKVKLLNALMRSTDPSVRLRAIELADKRRERELERERAATEQNHFDPIKTIDELAVLTPVLAAVLAVKNNLPWPKRLDRFNAMRELEGIRDLIEKNTADTAGVLADAQAVDRTEAEKQATASNGKAIA